MLKPIESNTVSKTGDAIGNQDGLVITGSYIGVIDAYQTRGWRAWNKMPGGLFARTVLERAIGNLAPGLDHREAFTLLHNALQSEGAKCIEGMADEEIYAFPMARVTIYSADKKQIWRLGDSPFVVDGELNRPRNEALEAAAAYRAQVLNKFLAQERDLYDLVNSDIGRSAIMETIAKEDRKADGVTALTARQGASLETILEHVEVFQLHDDQMVILGTDGYPHLLPTLDESEDWLMEEKDRDPLFINDYKALRGWGEYDGGYDDRTYVRFVVE